eukprot:3852539-Pyramimonas_sp.AAC.1
MTRRGPLDIYVAGFALHWVCRASLRRLLQVSLFEKYLGAPLVRWSPRPSLAPVRNSAKNP